MKYPNHILLDVNKISNQRSVINWTVLYKSTFLNNTFKKSIKNTLNNKSIQVTSTGKNTIVFSKKVNNDYTKNNSLLWSIFDINFLKKEKIYTKLKYSRSPAYDMVSGGVAALFSGFLGFLISEKFGIELVDSGDFYTFFMYCVFLSFSLRPFLKVLSKDNTIWHFFSYKFLLNYLVILVNLTFKCLLKSLYIFKNLQFVPKFLISNNYIVIIFNSFFKLINFLKNYPKI